MEQNRIPQHVAIILDGNGRWAKERGLPRTMGHREGCRTMERTVYDAAELGIKYLTVYGFSTENWKRSEEEVGGLMQLFRYYMKRLLDIARENNTRVRVIGDRSRFDADIIEGLNKLERETKDNDRIVYTIAVNYGARDEMRRAVTKIAEEVKAGTLDPEEITEETISRHLDTGEIPDPDLLIRTGGDLRLFGSRAVSGAVCVIRTTDKSGPKGREYYQGGNDPAYDRTFHRRLRLLFIDVTTVYHKIRPFSIDKSPPDAATKTARRAAGC